MIIQNRHSTAIDGSENISKSESPIYLIISPTPSRVTIPINLSACFMMQKA